MARVVYWIGLVIWMPQWSSAQELIQEEITLMFYNVENLFDVRDDSLTIDEAFLPGGDRYWTYNRFQQKLKHLYKVIAGVGEWQPPAIIALAEVENRYVLEALLQDTPLHRFHYEIIHQDSPDARGIDVALLYRPDLLSIIRHEFISVDLPTHRTTRDILYVQGQLAEQDTVHLYVNHWPSRYSGTKVSEASRMAAAKTLQAHIQSVIKEEPDAKVLVTGDFNDTPEDASMLFLVRETPLQNLSHYAYEGTHKHQGEWGVLDQWLASQNWQEGETKWVILNKRGNVFHPEWLLEADEANLGYRPKRTYVGFKYQGGFSDHLPIYLKLTPQ
uniref:Endonuclease/exonuclease/phosphatase family protein n=1 Tax=Roseihalotalea indica TaxID=2867963 RepID=A0AA49JGE5_9BACT|nr:endonuclease/exonuclease/phosphatase family protein [Tunicatimonas sp. TK19036]